MSSSADIKTCGICSLLLEPGQGQAIFITFECAHSFHFGCISSNPTPLCPVCSAKWKDLPFPMPSIQTRRICRPRNPFQTNFHPEPLEFSDDEPLQTDTTDPTTNDFRKVSIKAIPELPAVVSSQTLSQFAVLVGLKAPSLPDGSSASNRAPIDLVTVLDVSGSMQGSKLDLLKRAVHFVIDNLGPYDRLSIVSFSSFARRVLPLSRMTEDGREKAKQAVDSLIANGNTNIVDALRKGVRVLTERRQENPVSTIIFLSDGNDNCNYNSPTPNVSNQRQAPGYLHLLPASICPRNQENANTGQIKKIPVHAFGFGRDHDPIAMHAISDASAGTFSFIESYEMVQDAFASCIGGLLSVVAQELILTVRSASHGVEIKSIPSGRYASEITNQGSDGLIDVGDLYADEEKEFLIILFIPILSNDQETEQNTTLLDIACSYKDAVSKERVQVECDLVEIRRPKSPTPSDMIVSIEVDRQKNRLSAAQSIAEAQEMAEMGNLIGARSLLSGKRSMILGTASAQAGDRMCLTLDAEMKETEKRMGNQQMYEKEGRAYALSGMSSHAFQRATTRGEFEMFGSYGTPQMAMMVNKSQQLRKTQGGDSAGGK